jgi:hypothetical protein
LHIYSLNQNHNLGGGGDESRTLQLKVLSSEFKMGRSWYQSAGIALVLGRWTFFYNFKDFAKNILPPLEHK